MKRRFLVAVLAEQQDGFSTMFNSVIDLEHDERMNATAIDQIEKLLAEQKQYDKITVLNFQQLEAAGPRYAIHDQLRDDWMAANTYCTDNDIEGPGSAIGLLIEDHKRVDRQRNHYQGILIGLLRELDIALREREPGDAGPHPVEYTRRARDTAVSMAKVLDLDIRSQAPLRHPMTPNVMEFSPVGIDSEAGSHD